MSKYYGVYLFHYPCHSVFKTPFFVPVSMAISWKLASSATHTIITVCAPPFLFPVHYKQLVHIFKPFPITYVVVADFLAQPGLETLHRHYV